MLREHQVVFVFDNTPYRFRLFEHINREEHFVSAVFIFHAIRPEQLPLQVRLRIPRSGRRRRVLASSP